MLVVSVRTLMHYIAQTNLDCLLGKPTFITTKQIHLSKCPQKLPLPATFINFKHIAISPTSSLTFSECKSMFGPDSCEILKPSRTVFIWLNTRVIILHSHVNLEPRQAQ